MENSIRAWEKRKATNTIYLDFAKAFDKVDHDILCHKLRNLGIKGKVGIWIKEFLSGRSQQVSANGALSDSVPVISGVPQGTVLGPILFIIMISDLGKELTYSVVSKYADDTKNIARISNLTDAECFQYELDNIVYPWAPENNMTLNGDKFEYHRIGKKLKIERYSYKDPTDENIVEKEYIKDLGVYISSDLTWKKQIEETVSRARLMLGWALRTFQTREVEPMVTVWNSLIRPHLDYCSPLWSPRPTNVGEIDLLESTQRVFTRSIRGMEGKDYAQRLNKLPITSIQRRHERYKILYAYKVKEGLVPNISKTHGLEFVNAGRRGCICVVPTHRVGGSAMRARDGSFALTARNLWNSLPRSIRDIGGEDLSYFKRKLDRILSLYPDVPRSGASCNAYNEHFRKSNSLCDHYQVREVRELVNKAKI